MPRHRALRWLDDRVRGVRMRSILPNFKSRGMALTAFFGPDELSRRWMCHWSLSEPLNRDHFEFILILTKQLGYAR